MVEKKRIVIISDGIGDTAREIVDCTLAQFDDSKVSITRHTKVHSNDQIDSIIDEAEKNKSLLIFTIVSKEIHDHLIKVISKREVEYVDLLSPILNKFSSFLDQSPAHKAGKYRAMDENYFKRVSAMEFVLNNDDGKNIDSIHEADIILVGISRTSKTPLSVYLSLQGYKVINIPLIPGTKLQSELFKVDQKKIFGLTIAPEQLVKIRGQRLTQLGAESFKGDYADYNNIIKEVDWAEELFSKNTVWPIFDVTNKAIEETAVEIQKILKIRKKKFFT